MTLLKKATNEQAYLKCGLYGDPGSGKTTTASYLAMAISEKLGHKKPIAFFETEAGSDFLVSRFELEGIELLRVKSHSLQDLLGAAEEAQQQCSVLIVDSVTHVWQDLLESKLRAVNDARAKKRWDPLPSLEFQHYNDVKRQWARWTSAFLNSPLHTIVCGRVGDIWQHVQNEDTGKKELQSAGTRMSAEKNFGYEPSLTIEMQRIQKGNKPGAGWLHRATILKDRSDNINGKTFDFEKPKAGYKKGDWKGVYKQLEPAILALNLGTAHRTYDSSRNAQGLFPGAEGEDRHEMYKRQKEIALEEIKLSLAAMYPGTGEEKKVLKATICEEAMGARSWAAVESKSLPELQRGMKIIKLVEAMFLDLQPESIEDLRLLVRSGIENYEDKEVIPEKIADDDREIDAYCAEMDKAAKERGI